MNEKQIKIEKGFDIELAIKKATMRAGAEELLKINIIDEKRYLRMLTLIDKMKQ